MYIQKFIYVQKIQVHSEISLGSNNTRCEIMVSTCKTEFEIPKIKNLNFVVTRLIRLMSGGYLNLSIGLTRIGTFRLFVLFHSIFTTMIYNFIFKNSM